MSGTQRFPAGRLKRKITLQQPILTPDGGGGYTRSWQDVVDLWAEVLPFESRVTQGETLQDLRLQSRITHRITVRYREGITTDMRFVDGSRYFVIRTVRNPKEEDVLLEILAEEGAA